MRSLNRELDPLSQGSLSFMTNCVLDPLNSSACHPTRWHPCFRKPDASAWVRQSGRCRGINYQRALGIRCHPARDSHRYAAGCITGALMLTIRSVCAQSGRINVTGGVSSITASLARAEGDVWINLCTPKSRTLRYSRRFWINTKKQHATNRILEFKT